MKIQKLAVLALFPILLSSCASETDKKINEFKEKFGEFQTAFLNRENLAVTIETKIFNIVDDVRKDEPTFDYYDQIYLIKEREVEQEQFYAYDSQFKRTIYVDLNSEGTLTTYDLNTATNKFEVDPAKYGYYPSNNGAGVCTPYKYGRDYVDTIKVDRSNSNFANFQYSENLFSFVYGERYNVSGEYIDGKISYLAIGNRNQNVYYESTFTDISYNLETVPEKFNYEIAR